MRAAFIFVLIGLILLGCTAPPEQKPNATNNTTQPPPCAGPVCGSDNVTYDTDCAAGIANVSVQYPGECQVNCTETDNGVDIEIPGSVVRGDVTARDECVNGTSLLEYTCIDNQINSTTVDCGDGKECREGRCVAKPPPPPPQNETPPVNPGCVGPSTYDVYAKGSVTLNGTAYSDSCVEFQVVKDYFCKDGKMESINNECPPGYGCVGGACLKQEFVCTETDAGRDIFSKGSTVVTKGISTSFNKVDECDDIGTVIENYCTLNGTAVTENIECGSGYKCVSGRCIKSQCTDTDGGRDIYDFGTAKGIDDVEYDDDCIDDYEIREYFCYGDDVDFDDIRCGSGYICNESEDECVEGSIG